MASLLLYILTFNCGRTQIQPDIFAPHIFDALASDQTPNFVIFNLQEVAPIGYSFLGGSFLTPYFNAFRQALKLARPGYVNVITRNVGLTAIMVFARDDIASNVSDLETAGVGVGLYEMGNKGAVGVRLRYEDVVFSFVSAHLAPMEGALDQRNLDFQGIAKRLVFVPDSKKLAARDEQDETTPLIDGSTVTADKDVGGMYFPGSYLFFAGDLNYRTSLLPPSREDVKDFPQPRKDKDDPLHFSHLLAEDQLTQEIEKGKTLHGLNEVAITFPPTYKYDSQKAITLDGDEQEWKWAPHRWPSWCDRIFYSSTDIKPHAYKALPLFGTSDHRPVALSVSVPLKAVTNDSALAAPFPVDADWKSRRAAGRRKEIFVGLMAYLALTWEGNGLLLATTLGGVGGYLIIRSMLIV